MRRVRRKGGNKEKVFGCDLLEHLNASSQEVPLVLRCCSEFVETHGIVDGIYRLSGVSSNIQKLRGEFESDGSPDLNKDLYLQDIHCVSSLCKAYFRELPNPLLTYQLYDKFAEAVAIQLEEERLVKIRDVLKELPRPHYRTLEFLMRHLVRVASYSSETNMHARNLAIVWAPNLLRSKDIEVSGFNGRAAFMEVRVQSIVVEFILTHVPQLFPEQGVSSERRKSLPSPTAASCLEEGFFKPASSQPHPHFGNISPGDGPLPIRPYHAIIEGTDKRKGSLKGRKWMSIFNIGGRFPDPRRRHKHSVKEKERPVLRPARSMDSLSTPSYPNEGSRRAGQRPPSTNMSAASPLVTHSSQSGSDATASSGALGGSEYAVTYRRGTGLVSGGAGTQGTYTALDPEGLGVAGNETLQSRSPGLSTKAGRRAAMHITGPTMVTVPLHITSNLALGVLQGGGSNRVIHRGRDKDGGDKVEGKEGGVRVEKRESRAVRREVEWGKQVEEEDKNHTAKVTDTVGVSDDEVKPGPGRCEEEEGEAKKEEEIKEVREERRWEPEAVIGGRGATREQRTKSLTSNTEEDNDEDAVIADQDADEYMDMQPTDFQSEVTQRDDDRVFEASDILNSTEMEADDLGLSGYVQDNFEFLDQMDCSALDHMDCSVSYQVNEFSVEPPGHSDDEYEVMEQAQPSDHPAELQTHLQPRSEALSPSQTEPNPHRPLSIDIHSRHAKSLSLPYMTSPVHDPEACSSEEDMVEDDSDDDYSSEEDESMFVKSLPPDFFLNDLEPNIGTEDSCALDGVPVHQLQISEERERQTVNPEFPACKETTAGDQEVVKKKDEEETDELEEEEITQKEEGDKVQHGREQLENCLQSETTREGHRDEEDSHSDKDQPLTSEASTHCSADCPLLSDDTSSIVSDVTVEEEKKVVVFLHDHFSPGDAVSCGTQEETADTPFEEFTDFSVRASQQPRTCSIGVSSEGNSDEGEDRKLCIKMEDTREDMGLDIRENAENPEDGNEVIADIKHEEKLQGGVQEHNGAIRRKSDEIWDEIEDVVCELIQAEECERVEEKDARESVAGEKDTDTEQIAKMSEEEMWEADGGGTDETELRIDVVEESTVTTEEKLTDTEMQQEFEGKETDSLKTSERVEAVQVKHGTCNKTQHHDKEEVASKEKENNGGVGALEKQSTPLSTDQVRSDMKELKEGGKNDESDSGQGGVGRKLVVSKHPKVYQIKAVPVVPPKPQHCKITALTLRQQQQERERREAERGRENTLKVPTELDKDEDRGKKEKPPLRGGERERERRKDGDESAVRDMSRNSPLSMCFDEAVAKATMRREKEKECEKERQRDWGNDVQ